LHLQGTKVSVVTGNAHFRIIYTSTLFRCISIPKTFQNEVSIDLTSSEHKQGVKFDTREEKVLTKSMSANIAQYFIFYNIVK
jgi:hypothetical protein